MASTQKPLRLPRQLLDQIGGDGNTIKANFILRLSTNYIHYVDALSRRKFRSRPDTRKELRKVARTEKKSSRNGPPPTKRKKLQHSSDPEERYERPSQPSPPLAQAKPTPESPRSDIKPKSILKRTKKADPVVVGDSDLKPSSRSIPRGIKAKLADDDAEIAALEKKLGLKGKKKLPKSFTDDGLDMLLEGLGDDEEDSDIQDSKKRKAEGDEWLDRKRKEARKLAKRQLSDELDEDEDESRSDASSGEGEGDGWPEEDDGDSDMSLDGPAFPDDESEDESLIARDDDGADFSGFGSDEDDDEERPAPRIRENPYVAPSTGTEPHQKYIPPSLRNPASSNSEALVRLRRQTQGLVNRLTEANLIPILGDIEKLYRDHPRQHVTSTLVDILLTSVCEPTSLPDTLIILPAGFIAAIYKIIGMDFGAQVIQRTVELFDEQYARLSTTDQVDPTIPTSDISKETSNLIMLLSELYNFHVIGSNLIFDYIKTFLNKLSELNVELLLKIIRTSGPQLRQDDPSSLKEIVAMLRPAIASVGEENMSVRTKFMIETINNLKNNRMKTGATASAVASEHTIRMKKTLGTLNTRSIKASEPLRIGLNDIQNSDKKGKWWLVGASWSGNTGAAKDSMVDDTPTNSMTRVEDTETTDLLQLAREQRMNTDVRRAIFVTIMSATDYQDAYLRLLKLKLKKVQEYEIPKVLIHCSGAEKAYNPYYTLIAKKICGDRRLRTAFQYCLWDLFKTMGESDDDDVVADDDETLDMRHIVNLAKMFGTLILEGGLGLGALKNLSWSYLQPKTKTFMEVLFVSMFLQSQKQAGTKRDKDAIAAIFSKIKDMPQLMRGLQYFLKKVVSKTDITGVKEEKDTVKWACRVARDTLEKIDAADISET
ncbi:uncharacterized protein BP5553_08910 [Venustampulla echinocandica]|uniref:MI domain-containing protein n=1 Tax=Venustampulla echinocandica TaxID=2656787 RepID=A0A370TDE4_9HELO|nr:uncharacterized protein BP5553_08910 [Venustampulla echinocandica]RDL32454.1 hypothetical protein BP5553_08910 [Venustampulla echinocandica]